LQSIRQPIETAVDLAGDRFELILIGQHVQLAHPPEPRGRLGSPLRQLQQFRGTQEALITKQRQAAAQVIVAAGGLDQATTAVALAIAVELRRIAQLRRQIAGVVLAQVLLSRADPERRTDARMIEFNCWAGLSLSELIGLAVEDVDLEAGLVQVRRALVVGEFKVPKEHSRVRVVELIDPALELMREIVADAKEAPTEEITVIQRDNITSKKMEVRFLFHSSTSGLLWSGKTLSNWFTAHLKKAEVRHRGANQCRHTFASQMLSSYVPVEWVARQLGHADTTMVRKHYGRWIPKDTKSMAGIVSKMLGFRAD